MQKAACRASVRLPLRSTHDDLAAAGSASFRRMDEDDSALRLQFRASIARCFFGSASVPVDADILLEILVRRLPPLSVLWQRWCRLASSPAGFLRNITACCRAILSRLSFACFVRYYFSSSSSNAAIGARARLCGNAEHEE